MVGRNAEMGRALLHHLQNGVEHPYHCAKRPVDAFREAPEAVEMAEQLVRSVNEMDDHDGLRLWVGATAEPLGGCLLITGPFGALRRASLGSVANACRYTFAKYSTELKPVSAATSV